MSERKAFYVRCPREGHGHTLGSSICTGLQVIIPDGMTYEEAVEFVCNRVATEFRRYMVHECLLGLGFKPSKEQSDE